MNIYCSLLPPGKGKDHFSSQRRQAAVFQILVSGHEPGSLLDQWSTLNQEDSDYRVSPKPRVFVDIRSPLGWARMRVKEKIQQFHLTAEVVRTSSIVHPGSTFLLLLLLCIDNCLKI